RAQGVQRRGRHARFAPAAARPRAATAFAPLRADRLHPPGRDRLLYWRRAHPPRAGRPARRAAQCDASRRRRRRRACAQPRRLHAEATRIRAVTRDLSAPVGAVTLKNPVICGAGEHLIEAAGIESALAAGAAAAIVKSTNESEAARAQLDLTDYALLDSHWRRLPWNFAPPRDSPLFCRSGLTPKPFNEWLDLVRTLDRKAREHDAYVVPSIIPADL